MTGQQLANFILGGGLLMFSLGMAVVLIMVEKGKW